MNPGSRSEGDAGSTFVLPAYCMVGRAPGSDLMFYDRSVSGQHASIEWTGGEWALRDLGSRNGTIVDSRRLIAGGRSPLMLGSQIQFGADPVLWVLRDVSPPTLMAQRLSRRAVRTAVDGLLTLPGDEAPEWRVYQDGQGAWLAERAGERRPIEDRAILAIGPEMWRVYLPLPRADRPVTMLGDLAATHAIGLPALANPRPKRG